MKDRIIAWMSVNVSTLGATALVVAVMFMLTACGTVAGLGKDIQTSAEWTKEKMSGTKLDEGKK
jgi:predicted small secreted protein